MFLLAFGCTVGEPQEKSSAGERNKSGRLKSLEDMSFDQLYAELEECRKSPAVMISSITSDHNDCEAFHEIVRRGDEFLPQIIKKVEEGDFFLNEAMQEITGIKIHEIYPDEPLVGEQSASRLWIRWWNSRDQASVTDKNLRPPSQ